VNVTDDSVTTGSPHRSVSFTADLILRRGRARGRSQG
jgi:hypothetical protein